MIIGISLNPESGKGRGSRYRREIFQILSTYDVKVVELVADSAEQRLLRIRTAVQTREIDALIVAGGDGMIHLAVAATAGSNIPLGIVAIGTGNDIAREFMLPSHHIEGSLQQIMTAFLTQKFYLADVLEITSRAETHYALAIASVGIDADVNQRANQMSWPKGNLRYLRAIPPALKSFQPYGVKLTIDGVVKSGSITLLSIANTRYFGGGLNIAPDALPNDGLLDLVLVGGLKMRTIGGLLSRLMFERHTLHPFVHTRRIKSVLIEPDLSCGAQPPALMADGEYICELPAKINVLPGALQLAM
ncbi:diacylglycerol/lipid kinase family protein [Arcanobacterium hippocoleae]|uniref:Diacylglycerol kinase (ATP) n=1 Tax=Arcanobacterium hippocoleae TaxID=149017 RepID=A0ABU1T0C3_9ACTO|nr:diacylglycerol kinase family protein [Arcanobacterium hippocoleae]MDR6938773.1 diacylglycerol kinase (ATP) [Arcanobacterium hippocoleae]